MKLLSEANTCHGQRIQCTRGDHASTGDDIFKAVGELKTEKHKIDARRNDKKVELHLSKLKGELWRH